MKKSILAKALLASALSIAGIDTLYAGMASCLQAHPVTVPAHMQGNVFLHAWSRTCVFASTAEPCVSVVQNCIDSEIQAAAQNAINNANTQVGNLTGRYNTDLGNINTRFTNDEAAINNNHNNVLAQIQATNNSIAGTVANTVNQQLPAQVLQNLPQVVQSQLTPTLIAQGLQSQYQTAINTKFKQNSGALYIRGFDTTVDMDGQQVLNVYPVDSTRNFCAGTSTAEKPYASLYLSRKNASVIAAYLLSAYATGKPVVLDTDAYTTEGNYHCVIKNINASVDINSLKV
ncbi:MAG: hypothetical protein O2809_02765 [Proteobacteria bacterium]|nr:hypothetical protein [Pseudomonadota bacterium]